MSRVDYKNENIVSVLNRFQLQVDELIQHKACLEPIGVSLNMNKDESILKTDWADHNSIVAWMVCFRTFYMKDSTLGFLNVVKRILQEPQCANRHKLTAEWAEAWERMLHSSWNSGTVLATELADGQREWSAKEIFDTWLNSGYLHREQYRPGSGKGLDVLKSHPMFEGVSKMVALDFMQRLSKLILAFDFQVIQPLLAISYGTSIKLPR